MEKIPIIIDVDTGTDDAIAITAALLCQEQLDIRAFTTVMGNVAIEKTSRNTLNLVDYLGWDHKVAVGAARPLKRDYTPAISHGNSGLGDVTLPKSIRQFYENESCETIYEEAVRADGKLQILAVGPLTNLALAIERHPDIIHLIDRITIMGGGLYGGNMTLTSEFNIYNDPEAAKIVFDSGISLWMVGLDVTLKPKLPREVFESVKAGKSKYSIFTSEIFDFMYRRKEEYGGDDPNLHDVIALSAIVKPEILIFEKFYMTVECEGEITRGMTIADFNHVAMKEANVWAAVDINVEMFWDWLTNLIRSAE